MMAFGGAGPIHAAGVARELGIKRVLIPPAPGVFSAFGLLRAEVEQHAARTVLTVTRDADCAAIGSVFDEMRADLVARLCAEGYAESAITINTFADLRYRGQSSEITVPVAAHGITEDELRAAEARFEGEFERTYGHRGQNKEFELVTCRLIASVVRGSDHAAEWAAERGAGATRLERSAYFGPSHGAMQTPVIDRAALARSARRGPLVVQEYDTSVVVPPDCTVALDAHNNIVMEVNVA